MSSTFIDAMTCSLVALLVYSMAFSAFRMIQANVLFAVGLAALDVAVARAESSSFKVRRVARETARLRHEKSLRQQPSVSGSC